MSHLFSRKRLAIISTAVIGFFFAAFSSSVVSQASGIDSIFTSTAPQTYFGPLFTRADGYVDPATKVSDAVREDTSKGKKAEVVILLADQADVSAAYDIKDEDERGWFVYNTLTTHAAVTQADLQSFLTAEDVKFRSFWVANMLVATVDASLVDRIAERADVARVDSNRPTRWIETPELANEKDATRSLDAPAAIEWGVTNVKAPDVWAAGFNGQGIVIGELDTGVRWTHNVLKPKYRGWNGTTADHNFNWWDSIHAEILPGPTPNPCGLNLVVPCDDNGHGTHTAGTTVGDDGTGNQVGVAPGAKWIGCRNMESGIGRPETYAECFQFMIAPTDLTGNNANPTLRPHVLNNSWGCPTDELCTTRGELETITNNVQAAGIFVVVSAGNSGPNCFTVADPPAIYTAAFSVGAYNSTNTLASFSSRGPSTFYTPNVLKPNISAPGVSVRSATRSSDTAYSTLQGTSMAGPHVAGVVALLWSGRPALNRDIAATKTLLQNTANPAITLTTAQTCGGIPHTQIPNNSFGYGRIDALAAYNAAGGATPTPTNTPTATPTNTPTATPTNTPTATPTNTPTATPTNTPTATPTNTPTATPTATPVTPSFSIDNVTQPEGNAGNSQFIFTITRSGDSGGTSSVTVNTSDGTATVANNDYMPVTNQIVSFLPGTTVQQVAVVVIGDLIVEDNEVFNVNLSNPVNGVIAVTPGFGTILSEDSNPTGLEGDVAPRPNGDFTVNATDVTQTRRFATGLDTPNSMESMRADCSPRASLGDGSINSGDVIQARRYAAGLDPLSPGGGPTFRPSFVRVSELIGGGSVYDQLGEVNRLSIVNSWATSRYVELSAGEVVSAVMFTLVYDPKFGRPTVTLPDDIAHNAVITVNSTVEGKLTVLIDSAGVIGSIGEQVRIAQIGFDIGGNTVWPQMAIAGTPSYSDALGN